MRICVWVIFKKGGVQSSVLVKSPGLQGSYFDNPMVFYGIREKLADYSIQHA